MKSSGVSPSWKTLPAARNTNGRSVCGAVRRVVVSCAVHVHVQAVQPCRNARTRPDLSRNLNARRPATANVKDSTRNRSLLTEVCEGTGTAREHAVRTASPPF
jgi:hypothetical protein